jgi:hypothetical protein
MRLTTSTRYYSTGNSFPNKTIEAFTVYVTVKASCVDIPMKPARTITGTVHLTGPVNQFTAKTVVRVSASRTTMADAPAQLITNSILTPNWQTVRPENGIPFRLDNVSDDATLSVYVGEGTGEQLKPGDLITMESYPLDPVRSDGYQLIVKPI